MNSKTVLLTGGAGFIGSHTAVELLNAGYKVIIADDFRNSNPAVLDGIKSITNKNFLCYIIDVTDSKALSVVFNRYKIDSVIHFAGLKSVSESVQNPLLYYRNNIDTALTLLELMSEHQVKKIVFSSSATVYGVPKVVPLTEDMPTFCVNPYGWTKWMIEQIMNDVSVAYDDFSVVLLRYFNPIGAHPTGLIGELPDGIPNNLLPYICGVAAGDLPKLYIFGNDYDTFDGTGIRDYIHVVDLAKGHLAALDYVDKHQGMEVFNLGTGKGYSVLDIVHTFEQVNNLHIPYEFVERREGDVAKCYADTVKANTVLGWHAELGLEEMCRDAWRWQQYLKENEDWR